MPEARSEKREARSEKRLLAHPAASPDDDRKLSSELAAALRALVERLGEPRARQALGSVSSETLARLAAGFRVQRATAAQASRALRAMRLKP